MLKIYGFCLLAISLGLVILDKFPMFYIWPGKFFGKLCCWIHDHLIICSLVLGICFLVVGYLL